MSKIQKKPNKWDKNILKVLSLIVITVMLLTVFSACTIKEANKTADQNASLQLGQSGTVQNNEKETKTSNNNETGKENEGFPLKIKDAKGTEVTIEKKPEKIVSLTLTTDEMLLSLVDDNRIAAISHLSVDPGLSNIAEEAAKIPVKAKLELESLIALQPDLIIVSDWTDDNAVKQLRDANITVYAMATSNNIDEVKDAVLEVAKLVGEEQNGHEIVSWMNEKLKVVDEKIKTLKDDQKAKALIYDSFSTTYGKGTTFDSIAKNAGIINLASEAGIEMYQTIEKENIIKMNPDVIFLPSWSFEGFDAKKFTEDFKNDKSLAELKAVKNNKVFNLPDKHMVTTSQYIVLGVEDVAKAVYPDLFNK
ncbi:MAG TPA: ABC transporter substrate-binding protein [Clostridiales bacterium]|nr:ABC transporter substrate-binding protein [Clostridiales bacterium]